MHGARRPDLKVRIWCRPEEALEVRKLVIAAMKVVRAERKTAGGKMQFAVTKIESRTPETNATIRAVRDWEDENFSEDETIDDE